jgi:CPA1 family monovalent cation:H+ antiporter
MDSDLPINAARSFVALATVAALVALVMRRVAVPYEVGLVLCGLAASFVLPSGGPTVSPQLVLFVLLPGLVFEAAYRLELEQLRRTFAGLAVLAIPGVLVVAGVVSLVLHFTTGLEWRLGFVLGAVVAATDPASVVATFKRLKSPRRLATLVEGESLFNDGTGLVVFAIALQAVRSDIEPGDAVVRFVSAVVISAGIGLAIGFLASRIVARVDDHLIELTISVAVAYGAYLIADAIGQSGVIATVAAGIVFGNYGRRIGMSAMTEDAIDTVWEFIAFLITAFVFILVGLAIPPRQLLDAAPTIAWGIVAIVIGRAIAVYGIVGVGGLIWSRGRSRPMPLAWLHVVFWAGLRGAVAVAMALSLPADLPQRELIQEAAFGIVLFTLLVQGTTIGILLDRLGVGADGQEAPG